MARQEGKECQHEEVKVVALCQVLRKGIGDTATFAQSSEGSYGGSQDHICHK